MADRERQENEVTVLENICDKREFVCLRKEKIECILHIAPDIKNKLMVKYATGSHTPNFKKFSVEHLPPTRLYVQFPHNYPSENPPNFSLVNSWLSPWDRSKICQKLDELYLEYQGSEILFIWVDFLKNDILNYLDMESELDVTFLFELHQAPYTYINKQLLSLCDTRVICETKYVHPMKNLVSYSKARHKIEFEKTFHVCTICFEEQPGLKCTEFQDCKHIYCENCMKQYISLKIKDGSCKDISCPAFKCKSKLEPHIVKSFCPDLYAKYEENVLSVTLSTMSDIVFCPRTWCQYPVTTEEDESLAICPNCDYSFCIFCRKVYHGIMPCVMQSEEMSRLVDEYQNGTQEIKQMLEKRYGRRQIQQVVEQQLSNRYLQENTKHCPRCNTSISKTSGCNKMVCSYCQTSFCWLCGKHITTKNAYSHFVTAENNSCFGRLFEGDTEEEQLNEIELLNNLNWFNINGDE